MTKQWRVEYRLESGVSALQSGVETGLWSQGGIQSKVRVRLDSGVKREAKTGRMRKVGRRELERQVDCEEKCKEEWTLESSWRVSAKGFPPLTNLTRLVLLVGMYLPSSSSALITPVLGEPGYLSLASGCPSSFTLVL